MAVMSRFLLIFMIVMVSMWLGCSDHTSPDISPTASPPVESPRQAVLPEVQVNAAGFPLLKTRLETMRVVREKGMPPEQQDIYQRGIDRLRESGIADRIIKRGEKAPDFTLTSSSGQPVTLSERLKAGPVVLVWYQGGWSPYCNLELQAYQEIVPEIQQCGASIIALSPETEAFCQRTAERIKLSFDCLSDRGNEMARNYGLVYKLSDEEIALYRGRIDLEKFNGDSSYELPLPVTYIVDGTGVIQYEFIDPDYRNRAEPADVVATLKQIK